MAKTKLDIAVDSVQECAKYDVFLNGHRQTQCLVADAEKGYVIRYKSLFGVRVTPRGEASTERKNGKVEIIERTK